jgi:hypothetical protein
LSQSFGLDPCFAGASRPGIRIVTEILLSEDERHEGIRASVWQS